MSRLSFTDPGGSLRRLPRSVIGMVLAHIGIGVFVVGATIVSAYEESEHVRLAPGESYELAGRQFTLKNIREVDGPNYRAERATIEVRRGERLVTVLHPEKRFYHSNNAEPMTEAGIDPGVTRDLYVSLAEPLEGEAWAVRLNYKPYVRWLWFGPLLMAIGGVLAAADRRYRKPARATA
jgi:cytochrome c-type biogenesis protein CcmF